MLTLYVKVSGCQLDSKCDSFDDKFNVGFLYEAHYLINQIFPHVLFLSDWSEGPVCADQQLDVVTDIFITSYRRENLFAAIPIKTLILVNKNRFRDFYQNTENCCPDKPDNREY